MPMCTSWCRTRRTGLSGILTTVANTEGLDLESAFRTTRTPELLLRRRAMTIRESVVLITGGTGSFGNRVATQMLGRGPREVRIFSRDEKKQWDMSRRLPDYRYILGDVRDRDSLDRAMHGVDYVFHAAALKQVPSCEIYPLEAVKTNVLGSQNVFDAAVSAGVRCVVALSTDKAVKPVNAMGVSKAMMEKLVCSQNLFQSRTVFCCVRYGNVMGSRGSVIPLFRELIEKGAPLTITSPEMTRFLMSLDDSVDLVMHAMTSAKGGEIFVKQAPASTVLDLAKAISALYSPRRAEHPVEIVGVRPGEKIHEMLVNEYEIRRAAEAEGYFVIEPEWRDIGLNTSGQVQEYTSENTERLDQERVMTLLTNLGETDYYL